jgi:hypothetical protein
MIYTGMTTEQIIIRLYKLLTGVEPEVKTGAQYTDKAVGAFEGWRVGMGYQWTAPELPESLYPLIVLGANSEDSVYSRKGLQQVPIDIVLMIKAQKQNADIIGNESITRAWSDLEALFLANERLRDVNGIAYCDGITRSNVRFGVRMKLQTNDIDEYTAVGTCIYAKQTQKRSTT